VTGCPHHVTQRGNNGQDVFFFDQDRRAYLDVLKEQSGRFGLVVHAYCLMDNHVHLVVTPAAEDSLAKAIGRTNLYYTRYINRLYARRGHLWQDRFYSVPLDERHYWQALIYAERNPVRARICRKAWLYPWSSAAAHVSGQDYLGLLDLEAWRQGLGTRVDWAQRLTRAQDEEMIELFRRWGNRGCPLGSDGFISKLEVQLGRRLRPQPVGRPKKQKEIGNRPQ
jgi:putative transposase